MTEDNELIMGRIIHVKHFLRKHKKTRYSDCQLQTLTQIKLDCTNFIQKNLYVDDMNEMLININNVLNK